MMFRVLALFIVGLSFGCGKIEMPPARPPSVPPSAVWAGGEDGGAWIDCQFDPDVEADFCSVYFDRSGELWARTHFVLSDSGVGVPVEDLSFTGFDGLKIYLGDGRYLVPQPQREDDHISLAPIDAS